MDLQFQCISLRSQLKKKYLFIYLFKLTRYLDALSFASTGSKMIEMGKILPLYSSIGKKCPLHH